MGAVPRPPAGLAERIKADIPKYLNAEPQPPRITTSIAFTMRIAASLLLLITSVLVTLHVLEPNEAPVQMAASRRPAPVQLEKALIRQSPATATTTPAPAEEVRVDISEDIVPERMVVAQSHPVDIPAVRERDETRADDATTRNAQTFGYSGYHDARREAPTQQMAEAAPPPAAPVAEPEPARATPKAAAGEIVDALSVTAEAPSLIPSAYAADLELGAKKSMFGISVDPENFQHIKASLESGARPDRRTVNVEALVNYFAGPPSRAPRRAVSLEVEASPAPIQAEGDRAVLRFTIDTPAVDVPAGGSTLPAVKDVRVEVDIDRNAVATFRRIGEGHSISSEPVLLNNTSVTGLYELELRPRLKSSQRVATVRLRYHSVTDGRSRTIERVIRGRDLAKDWARASRRHRLASLGAVWGESLKNSAQPVEVARRAEELATQNPRDPRARELAVAASATGGER